MKVMDVLVVFYKEKNMKFTIRKNFRIRDLIQLFNDKKLNLRPPYQRNFIWGLSDQKELIDSISKGYPLPTFFLYERNDDLLEMVDGQQRTQTILRFVSGQIPIGEKDSFLNPESDDFLNYELVVVVIDNEVDDDWIQDFFRRVNKLGKHLNRSELNKADFLKTNFFKLSESLVQDQSFVSLDLFKDQTIIRMNDRDFVEELIARIVFGITEKKDSVDKLYHEDLGEKQIEEIRITFLDVIRKLNILNNYHPINRTRYKQKNDFYTLFGIIFDNPTIKDDSLLYFYRVLLQIEPFINPSNEGCPTLREYALNCVSQSNSKEARSKREKIIQNLLLNTSSNPNHSQLDVIDFIAEKLRIDLSELINIEHYYTFDLSKFDKSNREKIS